MIFGLLGESVEGNGHFATHSFTFAFYFTSYMSASSTSRPRAGPEPRDGWEEWCLRIVVVS